MRVIMLAPPGAGKGTQGERIASRYGIPHISSGELFRAEVASDSDLGRRLRGYLEAGDLVPDDLVLSLVTDRVVAAARTSGGYVLDGFPRTLPQAEEAARIARETNTTVQAVIYLYAPAEVLAARLRGRGESRADDSDAVARHRLAVYTEHTKPLLDYYADRGLVISVDATPPVDVVSDVIFTALDKVHDTQD
jgi:adenylate kinase